MRKTTIVVMAMAAFLVLAYAGVAYAHCGMCGVKPSEKSEGGEVLNDVCPVMGDKVEKDTPYKVEYQGQTIGLCCPGCIEKFNADPEKYLAKLQLPEKCIIKCPKCGAKIDVTKECKKLGSSYPFFAAEETEPAEHGKEGGGH